MSIDLEGKITSSLVDYQLPCTIAFKIAKELKIKTNDLG
jgi:hypothetical protein